MFDAYKKYLLIRHNRDSGTDDGADYSNRRDAINGAKMYLRDGWTTVACINTVARRVEFVTGEPVNVLAWFAPAIRDMLAANSDPAIFQQFCGGEIMMRERNEVIATRAFAELVLDYVWPNYVSCRVLIDGWYEGAFCAPDIDSAVKMFQTGAWREAV